MLPNSVRSWKSLFPGTKEECNRYRLSPTRARSYLLPEPIALAGELRAALLVDDYQARRVASQLQIQYFGSLRILKEAKDRGLVTHVRSVLDQLISTGTYISETLYQNFLRERREAN